MIQGYHYSSKILKVDDLVISHQTKAVRWKFVFPIYKEVMREKGLAVSPTDDFSYCYISPIEGISIPHLYLCKSEYIIVGNCNYSPLMALSARLKKEDEIREYAEKYIDHTIQGRKEIIGDWIVVDKLI